MKRTLPGTDSRLSGRAQRAPLWPTALLLWALLGLFDAALLVVFPTLPWANGLAWWVLPGAVAGGYALGALLVLATGGRRWWWTPFPVILFVGGAALGGAALVVRGELNAQIALVGPLLLGVFAATYPTLLPWMIFRARQVWLALALWWLLCAGTWNWQPVAVQARLVWWLAVALALSLLLVGFWRLYAEMVVWRTLNLQRVSVGAWQNVRALLLMTLMVTLVAFLPVGALHLTALTTFWQRQPLTQRGIIPYRSDAGTPIETLGAPLALDAESVSGAQVVLTYTMVSGAPQQTLLLGETFDHFDGQVWTQAPVAATVGTSGALTFPPGAELLRARITIAAAPDLNAPPLLVGFSQPIAFTLPTTVTPFVRTLTSGAPTTLTVADWRALTPLARGSVYETASAVLPADVQPTGSLPSAIQTRMVQVPSAALPILHSLAAQWMKQNVHDAHTAPTPLAQANTLLSALRNSITLDPRAVPPRGTDPVSWGLQHRRANGLLFTTLYILLGRAIGLPLRLAEGYLPGQFDASLKRLVVRASDGVVWAQLAIPGQGWADIETVARPRQVTVVRSRTSTPTTKRSHPSSSPSHTTPAPSTPWFPTTPFGQVTGAQLAIGTLLLALLIALCVGGALALRWSRLGRGLPPVAQFFVRAGALARLGGVSLRASDTSAEGTAKIVAALDGKQTQNLLEINGVYEQLTYGASSHVGAFPALRDVWGRLRGALLRLALTRPWRRAHQSAPVQPSLRTPMPRRTPRQQRPRGGERRARGERAGAKAHPIILPPAIDDLLDGPATREKSQR